MNVSDGGDDDENDDNEDDYDGSTNISQSIAGQKFLMGTFKTKGVLVWCPPSHYLNQQGLVINSLRPSDAYMRQLTHHHWFR